MASITITNLTSGSVELTDLYCTLSPVGTLPTVGNVSITTHRALSDLGRMSDLMAKLDAHTVSMSVVPTADELAAGVGITQANVATAGVSSELVMFHVPLVAGVVGTADDVTIFAANALPFKFRVLDASLLVSAAVGASTVQIWTHAAAAGTEIASFSSGSTGAVEGVFVGNATTVVAPSSTNGLFAHRSNNTVAGEVMLLVRKEQ